MVNVCFKNALMSNLVIHSFVCSFHKYLSAAHVLRAVLNSGDRSRWAIPEGTLALKLTRISVTVFNAFS